MTFSEESYLLDTIGQVASEIHENNIMLHQICDAINIYLSRHNQENEDDFVRNVLANLLSSTVDTARYRGK